MYVLGSGRNDITLSRHTYDKEAKGFDSLLPHETNKGALVWLGF